VNWFVTFLTLCVAAPSALAATVGVTIKDAQGAALEDAVVWVIPKAPATLPPKGATVEQRDKTFIPLVSVIQTGTLVAFPNRDEIRHHIYSFSPPKVFDIKLYAGTPVSPTLFDKPGEVVLGCNIHDHMIAYIYVVDSPWFAKANKEGFARIENVPAGDYDLHVRHFAQAAQAAPTLVKLRADETATAAFTIGRRPMPPRPAAK